MIRSRAGLDRPALSKHERGHERPAPCYETLGETDERAPAPGRRPPRWASSLASDRAKMSLQELARRLAPDRLDPSVGEFLSSS